MKANNITCCNALRLYQGRGKLPFPPALFFGGAILYLICIGFVFLIGLFDSGMDLAETKRELTTSWAIDFMLALMLGPLIATELMLTYEKHLPGGKFFRTVKGGFETFAKFRTGMVAVIILQSAVHCCAGALLHIIGIAPLYSGINSCIATFIFAVLAISAGNVMIAIRSEAARGILGSLIVLGITVLGPATLIITDGKIGALQLGAAAAAIVLLPVSHKFMLAYYKKNCWQETR